MEDMDNKQSTNCVYISWDLLKHLSARRDSNGHEVLILRLDINFAYLIWFSHSNTFPVIKKQSNVEYVDADMMAISVITSHFDNVVSNVAS